MKKLLLLLLLIPMLTFGDETISVRMPDGTILENLPKDITKQEARDMYERKLRIETKCANKSSKSSNEFSAREIYSNCLKYNNYREEDW